MKSGGGGGTTGIYLEWGRGRQQKHGVFGNDGQAVVDSVGLGPGHRREIRERAGAVLCLGTDDAFRVSRAEFSRYYFGREDYEWNPRPLDVVCGLGRFSSLCCWLLGRAGDDGKLDGSGLFCLPSPIQFLSSVLSVLLSI